MSDKLRPYPETKPSGLPWLGDVPTHWETGTFGRFLARIEQGWSPVAADGELVADQWAVLALSAVRRGSFVSTALKPVAPRADIPRHLQLKDGDLLLTRSNTRDLVGDVCIVNNVRPRTFMSDLIYRLDVKEAAMLRAFAMYQMLSNYGRWQIERDARGSSDSMPKIAQRHIRGWNVVVPPLDEQWLIVRFLDWHGARTAKLIRAKKQLIALLNEQKKAIIHGAVTRGLDPNAKLKPSGIPWLGDVPAHWEVRPLKFWASMNRRTLSQNTDPNYAFDYLDISSVSTGYIVSAPERMRFENAPLRARRIVMRGDTLISTVRTYLKAIYFIDREWPDLVASTGFAVLTPLPAIDARFFGFALQSNAFIDHVIANSIGVAYPAINETRLGSLPLALPSSREEQIAVIEHLRAATADLDLAIERVQRELALIQEFRTRLIADVVTGKLDVRSAAASLADIIEPVPDASTDGEDFDEIAEAPEDEEVPV